MICSRLQTSFLLLPTILLIICVSHGVSQSSNHHGMVMGRELVEAVGTNDTVNLGNSTLILAAKRTTRKDPVDGLKKYRGGWNISEQHYWFSVAFTAAPLFVIAAIWFVVFGLSLCLICTCYCCCPKEPYGYSRVAYALSLGFLIFFTITAIIGCVVLYTGQGKFHGSTIDTFEYVLKQGNLTVDSLRNVSNYLDSAQNIRVDRTLLPSDMQTKIDNIQTKINSSANALATRTDANKDKIQKTLDTVRLILIIVAAVMLFLAFLGFLFSIFGMKFVVSILVVIGWILVAGTFVLCGVFLVLHNVVGDTCVAMDDWVQHPASHTALDDILPCVDNATATETLLRTKEATHKLVGVVNQVLTSVSNMNFAPNFAPLYYNQSGPLVPVLCDPFNADLTDRQCSTGEVDLNNATQVWQSYVCKTSPTGVCTTVGRITPDFYTQMNAAVNVSYGLYTYGPFLVNLEDCSFVRETFSKIGTDYCPGLRRYSKWIFVGLVLVSSAVMLSLIFWVIYARERRHRVYTKQFLVR
ncbi:hypothetical protein MKW94_008653 [Papaver nudicaule]|uniref:Transmembrane protein n=1 Tax=Papaver nudicaule TaxID=74823 RepID=A0AA41S993_PAPNU|nr:hypothetical protein [Papaver nudicaule]